MNFAMSSEQYTVKNNKLASKYKNVGVNPVMASEWLTLGTSIDLVYKSIIKSRTWALKHECYYISIVISFNCDDVIISCTFEHFALIMVHERFS